MDEIGDVVIMFLDGIRNAYQIDDCTKAEVKAALSDLKIRVSPFESKQVREIAKRSSDHRA